MGDSITTKSVGSCVNSSVQQNQGVDPLLQTPAAIVAYSVAKFIAQKFHSAACLNSSCTLNSNGVVCVPTAGLNQFGCNEHGTLKVNSVNGTAPTTGNGKEHHDQPAASAAVPGWDCSATTAKTDLKNYGFLLSPLCGLAS